MEILNLFGWGLVWLLVLGCIAGAVFCLVMLGIGVKNLIGEIERKPKRVEPQHHLDADPLLEMVKAKRAQRQLLIDQWDCEFYGHVQSMHEKKKIHELEADHMFNLRAIDPEVYNFLVKLEERKKHGK